MSAPAELSGPDLGAGIPLADLADGGMLAGHAGGEAVLLARRGDEVFAVAANCTHYGGPLAEGLMVGTTVRCPWHHACFDLRSGGAVGAPALNDLACYEVSREGDTVRVGGKVTPAAAVPAADTRSAAGQDTPGTIVIAGAGAAGNAAAEMLRREGYQGRIVLVGREPSVPYDRPNLSKDYLAGSAPEEWIPLHPPEFYAERKIELRQGDPIVRLDPQRRRLELAGGSAIEYDALVIALGVEPIKLDIPGGVRALLLRSLADSRRIVGRATASGGAGEATAARRAVVLGASFIGLEVAAALRTRGLEVTVVAPGDRPLERVLGPELGDFVRSLHEEKGVTFRMGRTATAIDETGVSLDNGDRLPADLVVAGIGVKPAVALAERAGLAVDNGILVDSFLETSHPGIYAVGDLARYPDPHTGARLRVEHWVAAERQGQHAARNLLRPREQRQPFTDVPFFWSQHYDVSISYVGHAEKWDRIEIQGSLTDRNAIAAYREGGEVRAVATIFRDRESLEAELAFERGDREVLERVLAARSERG